MGRASQVFRAVTVVVAGVLSLEGATKAPPSVEIVVNGNFERGPNPGGFATLKGGDVSIPGWTVTGVSVDYIGTYWRGADGGRSIDLDGTPGPGGIYQILATRPGATYRLSFMLSGNGDCPPDVKRMQASAGTVARAFSIDTNKTSVSKRRWVRESFTFRAGGVQTRLALRSLDAPTNCGAVVDDVSVIGPRGPVPVPSPSAGTAIPPPNGPAPVACYVNAGAFAALEKPCFGPPSAVITVIQERTPPAGSLTLLFTANLTYNTAGAVSTPLSPFANGIATATAPPALCAGSSPHKWIVWLVDATGRSQGVIGDYTMTSCP